MTIVHSYTGRLIMNIILESIISIIIHIMDFFMLICLCYRLLGKTLEIAKKNIGIGLMLNIILGAVALYLDGYTYRVIATFFTLAIIKIISKRKIHDTLLIYVIIYLYILFIQFIYIIIMSYLLSNDFYLSLVVQIATLVTVLFSYQKVPFDKFLIIIEKRIVLKLFIFIIISFFFFIFGYFNFEYRNAREYAIFFSVLILITFVGLYKTVKHILFYTNIIPMQLHDVKNILMGIYISVHNASDIDVIKKEIDTSLEIMGMDMATNTINVTTYQNSILSFINTKKHSNTILFSTDIKYYESNATIPLSNILYMLGVLLDNAIESDTKKVIFIKVYISKEYIKISVANEYERKSMDDFERMFQEKYSTKEGTTSRGYGLSNLSKVVNNYGGKILLSYNYNKEQECNYLTLVIEIKD